MSEICCFFQFFFKIEKIKSSAEILIVSNIIIQSIMQTSNEMTNFECVGYFHQVFGHPKHDNLQTNVLVENPKLVQLRINLIKEEIGELAKAIKDKDMVEVIDGLGDILYVVYGAGHAFGINLDNFFKCVCASKKVFGNLCGITDKSMAKSNFELCCEIKESDKYPDCISTKYFLDHMPDFVQSLFSCIENEFVRFWRACLTNNMTEVINSLGELLYTTYSMACCINIDMDLAFKIVHESNMTKTCKSEQEAMESVEHYKTEPGFETANVKYRPSQAGPFYVMYNADTGKILKSKYFSKPDFTVFF